MADNLLIRTVPSSDETLEAGQDGGLDHVRHKEL